MLEATRCTADFWYTAWVNAGCPKLSEIQAISDAQKAQLKTDKTAWKKNLLIAQGLLQAKKVTQE